MKKISPRLNKDDWSLTVNPDQPLIADFHSPNNEMDNIIELLEWTNKQIDKLYIVDHPDLINPEKVISNDTRYMIDKTIERLQQIRSDTAKNNKENE